MRFVKIKDGDLIARSIMHPTHFPMSSGILVFQPFSFRPDKNGLRAESVNCVCFLPNEAALHKLGRELEQTQNERQSTQGKEPNRSYRGYIKALASAIRNIKEEMGSVSFEIFHRPVDTNYAHGEIEMHAKESAPAQREWAKHKLKEVFSEMYPA